MPHRQSWFIALTADVFTAEQLETLAQQLRARQVPIVEIYGPLGLILADLTGEDLAWLRRRDDVTVRPEQILSASRDGAPSR